MKRFWVAFFAVGVGANMFSFVRFVLAEKPGMAAIYLVLLIPTTMGLAMAWTRLRSEP